jgi:hypothetical protein
MYYRNDAPDIKEANYAPKGFGRTDTFQSQHYTLADVWTLRPNLVNELRVGYNRIWSVRANTYGKSDWKTLGFPWPQLNANQWILIDTLTPSFFNFQGQTSKYEERDVKDYRDTVSFNKGNHFMKGGAILQYQDANAKSTPQMEYRYGGGWLRNRAAEWLVGWPTSVCCAGEDVYLISRKVVPNVFFQDDWKVTPSLTLNLGIRYEPNLWAFIKNGRMLLFSPGAASETYSSFPRGIVTPQDKAFPNKSGRHSDLNNLAPRLGVAYRLDSTGKLVLRGGWGIFFDSTDSNRDGVGSASTFPFTHSYSATFDRGYPGSEGWTNIFAYQNIAIPDMTKTIDPRSATWVPTTTYGTYFPDGTLGYVHQWNVTLEHEFRPGWSYSAGYVANRGVGLWGYRFWNMPVSKDATDSWSVDNLASRRPNQDYRYNQYAYQSASQRSAYNAAQFTVKARTDHFNLISSYALSRSRATLDHIWTTSLYYPSVPFDDNSADWARTFYDRPHNLLVVPSWDLPVFRGRTDPLGRMLGGWNTTFVFNIQSGQRVNMLAAQNNTFTCSLCIVRPNATGQPLYLDNWRQDPNLVYLNAAAFRQPADRTFGNLARNAVTWPATKNVDFALNKSFTVYGEHLRINLHWEIFNLFNWVNWNTQSANSISVASSANFGMKTYWTTPSREMQVGARLTW